MKSFCAAALLTLAIITECFSAQSERSRSRSGPIRSVPVAADVKRDVDFDCPEEFGYYPHPTDCTLYYVCVFGGALLESCTGGLMYSNELQTCDWPRNVGCDIVSAGGEEVERVVEQRQRQPHREPQRPAPRRTPAPPPPPPPRAQPNPIVTSRGQPRYSQQEFEKQQQLYAEVDDLPPVEEIESDRQQRVYRGQPPTIGQVQKDRDGYAVQQISSGRNLNSNIIPASIPQNSGKIGSFSFGAQVNDRRTATVTSAPQSYSEDKSDIVTDYHHDRLLDVETNEINTIDIIEKPVLRTKREVLGKELVINETIPNKSNETIKRNDSGEEIEYVEIDPDFKDDLPQDETERGKRQIEYYLKHGYKAPGKNWEYAKPIRLDFPTYSTSGHKNRHNQQLYNNVKNNYYYEGTRHPHVLNNNNVYSTANPFVSYQADNSQTHFTFKPSLSDQLSPPKAHNLVNSATQIITKSPPISALSSDSFPALAGGFYNNAPQHNAQNSYQRPYMTSNNPFSFSDSSQVSSAVVTGKPVQWPTSSGPQDDHRNPKINSNYHTGGNSQQNHQQLVKTAKPIRQNVQNHPHSDKAYDDESSENNDSTFEEDEDEDDNHYVNDYKPPHEYTHSRYKDIENPFANPNFDFDAYLSKLSNGQYSTVKPNHLESVYNKPVVQLSTSSPVQYITLNALLSHPTRGYTGMSTPKPFTVPSATKSAFESVVSSKMPTSESQNLQLAYDKQRPSPIRQSHQDQQSFDQDKFIPSVAGLPLEEVKPKLKPPNFKDDRQLPLSYSFLKPVVNSTPQSNFESKSQKLYSVSQNPFAFISSTGAPMILSTPKYSYIVKPEDIIHLKPVGSAKPYLVSTMQPHNPYIVIKPSTPKPLTTVANEQLSLLQQFWNKNPSTENPLVPFHQVYFKQTTPTNIQKLENMFAEVLNTTPNPINNYGVLQNNTFSPVTTRPNSPLKRKPIPKPSPEMNDYYYEDDEEYYYEPVVKPKYMPSTEIRPQRPPMAQNYKEYDDSYENDEEEINSNSQLMQSPVNYNKYNPESATKNHNDVSINTKSPIKNLNKNVNNKVPIPVLVDYGTATPNSIIRPEISDYKIVHHAPRINRTKYIRRPVTENGPNTIKPPKHLNQTTLRPYTVRHRLAKPTTVNEPSHTEEKQTRGRIRHPNIVAQMKQTTPRDSQNQETRFTKIKHDDKSNSLEPTESIKPESFSPSPRPKMLYNGSQNYSPDQYDPFYAVYDEDGELYKDTEYVQQYNTASLRPAVQQTYRGTPPPARKPIETFTPRPSPEDYDEELIHPQINNQNQYQTPIRHSPRGEGNELGLDHNPSSVQTTLYEATTLSTTPPTTSTSTTTQRSTTALYTEAMTPSRYTPRSSTDENLLPTSSPNPTDETTTSAPITLSSTIDLSSLAKPFEKTDNSLRLIETLPTTEEIPTASRRSQVTNHNNNMEVVRTNSNRFNKKAVSLTSGFSIRRNPNNTNNPYTLTVLTRPYDNYGGLHTHNNRGSNQVQSDSNYKDSRSNNQEIPTDFVSISDNPEETSHESATSGQHLGQFVSDESDDIAVNVKPTSRSKVVKTRIRLTTPTTTATNTYNTYSEPIVFKKPSPFTLNNPDNFYSTENTLYTEKSPVTEVQNINSDDLSGLNLSSTLIEDVPSETIDEQYIWNKPAISPYRTLDNLRNTYKTPTTTSTSTFTPSTTRTRTRQRNSNTRTKPTYYSYHIEDEVSGDETKEILSDKVRSVIKTFLSNFVSSPEPQSFEEISTTMPNISTSPPNVEEKVINIGFQKKHQEHVDTPMRYSAKRLQIVTEPVDSVYSRPTTDSISFIEDEIEPKGFALKPKDMTTTMMSTSYMYSDLPTTPAAVLRSRDSYQSKFSNIMTSRPFTEGSHKFQKLLDDHTDTQNNNRVINSNDDSYYSTQTLDEDGKYANEAENFRTNDIASEVASTTSTTKATTTVKFEPTTTKTTKSISFPTRTSRINPAIKLAAANPGGGRRSYQSSSKCSSDNSLQANPKCNEIKYQRPTSTRGRGSAHYSTAGGSDTQAQPAPNRGTPPTRSRPTLKPSTSIVTKTTEFTDVYVYPPNRPAPVYPQPTPDKTAAKCRKDVCLLPDCYCGGKDVPGDLPVDQTPQIVILTFDDSVNDLNKGLYADLFEKGRVNPNGCPISATFYVSHEWTDYSQVQNLYSAGHEMASHTISHSFGEQFSQKKWYREVGGQREILAAYGGVKLEDVRGMRAPFLSVGGNKMFKMLHDANFTYDSSLPVYENKPPSWPYTLDYKLFHDCMIPPCPTKSYPGVWEVPMVMWQDLNGGRCSMGDACANPPEPENVYKMILKNFDRHYTTNRAPFGLFYHAAWFTQPHHKAGFIMFLDFINQMQDVWIVTNWQALQWVRDPTPINRLNNFQPFQCNYQDRPKKCNHPKVCNLWHKSGVRYMRTCQPCPEVYPWTGKSGIRSSRIDNDIGE